MYYNPKTLTYGTSQTSNILALYLGAPEHSNVSAAPAVAALVKDIQARGDALSSGALGTRYVFRALVDHGQWAVAMALATKTTSPSFGYMVAQASPPPTPPHSLLSPVVAAHRRVPPGSRHDLGGMGRGRHPR